MIENYKNLLIAIFNTDIKPTKKVVCVYDIKDNERCIGVFSKSKYCGNLFDVNSKIIDCYICKKKIRNKRYVFERVEL